MRPRPRARGNPYQRELTVQRIEGGISLAEAAAMAGWSERTGSKGLRRYREEAPEGLLARRSGPRRVSDGETGGSARRNSRPGGVG